MKRISKSRSRFLKKVQVKSSRLDSEDGFSSESDEDSALLSLPDKSLLLQLKSGSNAEQEAATALLSNLSLEISTKQISFLFSDPVLSTLLSFLDKPLSPQILINTLSSFASLCEAEAQDRSFDRTLFLVKGALLSKLEALMSKSFASLIDSSLLCDEAMRANLREILRKTIKLLAIYAENLDKALIESSLVALSLKFLPLVVSLEDEPIFIEILDLFHILTECSEVFRREFTKEGSVLERLTQVLQTKGETPGLFIAKGYIAGIFWNLADESAGVLSGSLAAICELLEKVLSTPYINETMKFLSRFQSEKKSSNDKSTMSNEEEKDEKPQILENSEEAKVTIENMVQIGRSIELCLIVLHSVFGNSEEQDFEDISEEGAEDAEEIKGEASEKQGEPSVKQGFREALWTFTRRGYFLDLISENLNLKQGDFSLIKAIEILGLERLISSILDVNYIATSLFAVSFEGDLQLQENEKLHLLQFFWKKTVEIASFSPEIPEFSEALLFLQLLMKSLLGLMEKAKDLSLKSGFLSEKMLINDVFAVGKAVLSLQNEELSCIYYEILGLRFPITLSSSLELLSPQQVSEIIDLTLFGTSSSHGLVIAEALNAIFDIFADETYNPLLHSSGLLAKIEAVKFEGLLNSGKRDKKFLKETAQNLREFIKYKRNLGVL